MEIKIHAAELLVHKDALHVYAAVSIQLIAAAITRRSLAHWLPWTVVLVAELINEGFDMWFGEEPQIARWQVMGATHDFLNTMALPTVLLLLARFAPWLFVRADEEPD